MQIFVHYTSVVLLYDMFSNDDTKGFTLILQACNYLTKYHFLGGIFVGHLVKNNSALSEDIASMNWQYLKR